jgi:hypothetical protein
MSQHIPALLSVYIKSFAGDAAIPEEYCLPPIVS